MAAYAAIYDFGLMPYALGDVLTWNVQTAIRCEKAGRVKVDVYICMDRQYPASIYQAGTVTAGNCGVFFSELFGAFNTHPRLGNLYFFQNREEMLQRLRRAASEGTDCQEALADYEQVLAEYTNEEALIKYFTKYIYFHENINAFHEKHGRIPLLQASMGCEPDVAGLIKARFADKRIVVIHTRLRRLDAGFGGKHTYVRDSDFLEWYEFLRAAESRFPDVQFVTLGRLQEKPLELLRLPNVLSPRLLGLGLGHELTLLLQSDLFIGTSSGFAAMANFSRVRYYITKMNAESCNAYRIQFGEKRLPFATDRQELVYEPETRELLMSLLEKGLQEVTPRAGNPSPALDAAIDVRGWEGERAQWLYPGATTGRFFLDTTYNDKETAFLLWPKVEEVHIAWDNGRKEDAWAALMRIESSFPRLSSQFPEFLQIKKMVAADRNDRKTVMECETLLKNLPLQAATNDGLARKARRYRFRLYPMATQLKWIWNRKHRIPHKLMQILRRHLPGSSRS
jgi:hypothetical protein